MYLFLFGTTNKDLLKVILKYGFKEYSCLPQRYEYIYIVNILKFIRQINLSLDLFKYFQRREINNFKGLSEFLKRISKLIYLHQFQRSLNRIGDVPEGVYTSSLYVLR